MKNQKQKLELSELFLKTLDGSIDAETFEKIDKLLREDKEALEYYAEFLTMFSNLRKPGDILAETVLGDEAVSPLTDRLLWELLAENERTAQVIDMPARRDNDKLDIYPFKKPVPAQRQRVSRLALYTAIFSTAALLMFIAYAVFNPRVNPVVATLTDTIDARWAYEVEGYEKGADLHRGPLKLVRGFAQITLDSGVEIIMQGPVHVVLETPEQVFLEVGKLSVDIQTGQAGFVVRTPSATVVDYGTEFGVAVDEAGLTETAVFKGNVELRTGSNPLVFEKAQRLNAGQAAIVDNTGYLTLKPKTTKSFARNMTDIRIAKRMLGVNLIINGDFEKNFVPSNPDFTDSQNMLNNVKIAGWQDDCAATVIPYDVIGGTDVDQYERKSIRMPANKGRNYFAGVEACSISQKIDLSSLAHRVNNDTVLYEFSGWLGGWRDHPDPVEVVATFLNVVGEQIGTAKIRSDNPDERNNRIGFLERSTEGVVPTGTTQILIELSSFEDVGISDSFADNLCLKLSID